MTWPQLHPVSPITVHPWVIGSIGLDLPTGGRMNVAASAVWTASNRAIYIPVWLSAPIVAVQLFAYNGSAVSGNIDVGLYAGDGTRLVSSGSTAQSGTSALQAFNITDTELGPGLCYLAVALDNTTGTVFRVAGNTELQRGLGLFMQETAFPLPATATFAAISVNAIPVVGLSTRTVL